jgi:hypothetical protein
VTSFQKAKIEGHKPRKQYFASIHKDIEKYFKNPAGKELQKNWGFSARNFSNLVGNLSNLQLRTLRKYFNDPLMANGKDKWKPENLKKNLFSLDSLMACKKR